MVPNAVELLTKGSRSFLLGTGGACENVGGVARLADREGRGRLAALAEAEGGGPRPNGEADCREGSSGDELGPSVVMRANPPGPKSELPRVETPETLSPDAVRCMLSPDLVARIPSLVALVCAECVRCMVSLDPTLVGRKLSAVTVESDVGTPLAGTTPLEWSRGHPTP